MSTLTLDSVLVIGDSVRVREESFGILVVSRNAPSLCMNKDAIVIWGLCDGNHKLRDIILKLTDSFTDTAKKEAEKKILRVINTLFKHRLLIAKE
jgi:hypothetical protein